ncbi:oxidoreductase NAD-binding domain-containing protein [Penicillium malachiteum]|uniref:oxidoreductase NAD-binding domain-containing protein n=1 Tax=Penicillium malachiteum TaxID=1324776 RepID=UPI00254766C3|nr:oxidoreductase NAD-binding domain-containing protein [Penicillium malachiteum]KAJ5729129.1 oxidoreductase NAD-binding domain-containing protein [Penicillium malachiteum]
MSRIKCPGHCLITYHLRSLLLFLLSSPPSPMSYTRFSSRKATAIIATIGVIGIIAARRISYNKEALAESTIPCETMTTVRPAMGLGARMGFLTLRLESSHQVNDNTKRLLFQLPDPNFNAGLGLTSFILIFHKPASGWLPVIRPYTPINNFNELGYIELLVKKYPNGPASSHLHSLKPGDTLSVRAPMTSFKWKPNEFESVNLIAGGAGITPIFQLIQGILNNPEDRTKIKLIFGVNTDKDLVLKEELDAFERGFPGRLKAVYAISNPADGSPFYKGKVTKELLQRELVGAKDGKAMKIFLCGPPSMEAFIFGKKGWFSNQKGALEELGYSSGQIFKF